MQASNSGYKQVKLPNGKIGRFPESMSWESISDNLKQQFPMPENNEQVAQPYPEQQAQQEAPQLLQQENNPINNFMGGIQKADSSNFFKNLPGNTVAGLAEMGHEFLNIPYNFAKLVEKFPSKDLTLKKMLGVTAEDVPHQQDYNFAQMLGLPNESSDKFTRGIAKHLPDILGAPALAKSLYTLGAKGIGSVVNLATGKRAAQFTEKERLAEEGFHAGQNEQAQKFIEGLGGPKTSEENIEEFARRTYFARKSAADEALAHKAKVFEPLGELAIIKHPKAGTEPGTFLKNPEVGNYINEGEGFNSYDKALKKLHNEYVNHPSLNNSDALRKQIGDRIRSLKETEMKGGLEQAGRDELHDLTRNSQHLLEDQNAFIRKQDPKYQHEYQTYRDKWTKNVSIYDVHPELSRMARTPESGFYKPGEGVTPSNLSGIFGFPKTKAKRVIEELGPSGRNNILLNELQTAGPANANKLAEGIKKAKQFGFQAHISPEMDLLAEQLAKGYNKSGKSKDMGKNLSDVIWDLASGSAAGEMIGHPLAGALFKIMKQKH